MRFILGINIGSRELGQDILGKGYCREPILNVSCLLVVEILVCEITDWLAGASLLCLLNTL